MEKTNTLPKLLSEIGEYKLLGTLRDGDCPCSVVYDRVCGRKVFIKRGESSAIQNEAAMLTKFRGVGVPAVYGCFEDRDGAFLMLEYIEGETLAEMIKRKGTVGEAQAAAIGEKVCRVLSRLHGAEPPVIHRDIKTENVMISRSGEIWVLDFGISREHNNISGRDTTVLGTPLTAPPEQFGYTQTDERSDVYAVGILLNELTTGSVKVGERKVRGKLGRIIRKCTEFSPDKRYKNASELLYALRSITGRGERLKKSVAAVCTAALAVCCLALGSVMPRLAYSHEIIPDTAQGEEYVFSDPAMGDLVRKALGKGEGEKVTEDELLKVTELRLVGADTECGWENMIIHGESITVVDRVITDRGEISSLEDLKNMPNLELIILCNQNITDISPLAGLNIRYLCLHGNGISDLSPLSECVSLVKLVISSNPVSDITPILGLPELTELNMGATDITSFDGLGELKALTKLEVHDCPKLEDMAGLKEVAGLTFLSLRPTTPDALEAIENMSDLRALYIWSANRLKSLEPLANLKGIKYLGLDSCGLNGLEGIDEFPKLEYLTFRFTHVEDISLLESAENLCEVALSGCSVKDYSPLGRMPSLGGVWCDIVQENDVRDAITEEQEVRVTVETWN